MIPVFPIFSPELAKATIPPHKWRIQSNQYDGYEIIGGKEDEMVVG